MVFVSFFQHTCKHSYLYRSKSFLHILLFFLAPKVILIYHKIYKLHWKRNRQDETKSGGHIEICAWLFLIRLPLLRFSFSIFSFMCCNCCYFKFMEDVRLNKLDALHYTHTHRHTLNLYEMDQKHFCPEPKNRKITDRIVVLARGISHINKNNGSNSNSGECTGTNSSHRDDNSAVLKSRDCTWFLSISRKLWLAYMQIPN